MLGMRTAQVSPLCHRRLLSRWNLCGLGSLLAAGTFLVAAGCSGPGVELRFYAPANGNEMATGDGAYGDAYVRVVNTALRSESAPYTTRGERIGDQMVHTLHKGTYAFEYQPPDDRDGSIFGQIEVHHPDSAQARKFVRHTYIAINPQSSAGAEGHAYFSSVLTDDDVRRVRMGDVIEKVVFVADQRAVDRRIDMIDQEIRHIENLESRFAGQLEYWNVKRSDRRRNAMYFNEYGEDVPAVHLASLQAIVGAESYHWYRFTEADDKVKTYEEEIAKLRLPLERLREERSALRGIQTSARVIHRRGEMMLMTVDMQRQFYDGVEEVRASRETLEGPSKTIEDPYRVSSTSMLGGGYPRWLLTNTGMNDEHESVGELIMVVRAGPRPLRRLN